MKFHSGFLELCGFFLDLLKGWLRSVLIFNGTPGRPGRSCGIGWGCCSGIGSPGWWSG